MKKYLAVVLSVIMVSAMSMTAFAADSQSASDYVSSSSSSSSKRHKSSSSGGAASTSTASSAKSSADTAKAAKDAAVQAKVQPTQAVVTASGEVVATPVSVTATTDDVTAAFGAVAQVLTANPNVAVSSTFVVNAAGFQPADAVSLVFTVADLPANYTILVVDAFGNLSVITPAAVAGNAILLTIPAACQIAVVGVPAA